MAQPASNPKIEELRSRLKTDPKNRIFYPLAEELRKVGQFAEAEQVLRAGLAFHPTYLSAWVSLGRVLRDLKNDGGAVEALSKALQLDPGNVVAARLLADAYLGMGEKIEAIKKYKLVQALLPGDEEIDGIVERLDRELNPPAVASFPVTAAAVEEESPFAPEPEPSAFDSSAARRAEAETPFAPEPHVGEETATMRQQKEPTPFADESPFAPEAPPQPAFASPSGATVSMFESAAPAESAFAQEAAAPSIPEPPSFFAEEEAEPVVESSAPPPPAMPAWQEPPAFTDAAAALQREFAVESASGDTEPMAAAHEESPFEEPAAYTASAFEIESPAGMHEERAPLAADVPLPSADMPRGEVSSVAADVPFAPAADESDVFAPAAEPEAFGSAPSQQEASDLTNTLTMADLYAKQGLVADARQIYENILQRDPANESVRGKLAALASAAPATETNAAAPDDRVTKLERWLSKVKGEVGRV